MKRITILLLLTPDAAGGGGEKTDKDRIAELELEVESLKSQLAAASQAVDEHPPKLRALIKEKRAAGLDLKTATEAARNQLAWDEQQKAGKAKT